MFKLAEDDTVKERLSYCNNCEHNCFGVCKKCGCVIKGKVRLSRQSCPINLWVSELKDVEIPQSDFSNQIDNFLNPK
jgi:hypothetical protein